MTGVLDTHVLAWYLTADDKLTAEERKFITSGADGLVIPTMVLCELKHLAARKRIRIAYETLARVVLNDPRVRLQALDDEVVRLLPTSLDIHYAVIVASYLAVRESEGEEVVLLSRDRMIRASGLAEMFR